MPFERDHNARRPLAANAANGPGKTLEPSAVVARALAARRPAERSRFLRELLAHAAAATAILDGDAQAAESLYRLADAVVARAAGR